MKTFIPPEPQKHGIEITPLIDVVFILLLFFILTSSFADPALEMDLPESETSSTPLTPDITIALAANETLQINGTPGSIKKLDAIILNTIDSSGKNPSIMLHADKTVPYRRVFEIIDLLKSRHITELQLAYSPESSDNSN